jgi:hypothetical protein
MPAWVSILISLLSLVISAAAFWRTYRMDRPILRFLFEGNPRFCENKEARSYPALQVRITNEGKQPISISQLKYALLLPDDHSDERRLALSDATLKQGEHISRWFTLFGSNLPTEDVGTIRFMNFHILDSSGKRWKPSKKELKQLDKQFAVLWPSCKIISN